MNHAQKKTLQLIHAITIPRCTHFVESRRAYLPFVERQFPFPHGDRSIVAAGHLNDLWLWLGFVDGLADQLASVSRRIKKQKNRCAA